MFHPTQFRELVIRPTLTTMELWSQEAEDLLIMTMAHESNGGEYLAQLGHGPAIGVYQMEKGTFNDIWNHLADEDSSIHKYAKNLIKACDLSRAPVAEEMEGNLYLATAMARIYYLRGHNPIPVDLAEMAAYAKHYWNTELGKATANDYLAAYLRFENYR